MADNTRLPIGTQDGDTYASDDVASLAAKVQRVKLTLGADGVSDGDVSSSNPIPSLEARGASVPTEGSFTSTSDAQILAAAAARKSFSISNDSDQVLFIRYGATAVTTSAYRVRIPPGALYTEDGWSGEVRGILAGAIGAGQVRYSAEQ